MRINNPDGTRTSTAGRPPKSKATRKLSALLFAIAIALPLVASGGAVTAQERDDWFRQPRLVGEDDEGDWGDDPALASVGDSLGQDLVEARIGMEDRSTVDFILKVTFLPPWGGVPEFTRYTWNFDVGGEPRELDGKWLNYSRGVCDPTSGQCPPPRDPGLQPFLLRGNCGEENLVVINFTACEELGHIQAEFDPGEGTITIPVPLEMLDTKPGARIKGSQNIFGGSVSAAPSAWLTSSVMPMDTMVVDKVFRIPKRARP